MPSLSPFTILLSQSKREWLELETVAAKYTSPYLEASPGSERVERHLESLGQKVIVSDPNYALMYANCSRRKKNDECDAQTLMDACETGAGRPAYRLSKPMHSCARSTLTIRRKRSLTSPKSAPASRCHAWRFPVSGGLGTARIPTPIFSTS